MADKTENKKPEAKKQDINAKMEKKTGNNIKIENKAEQKREDAVKPAAVTDNIVKAEEKKPEQKEEKKAEAKKPKVEKVKKEEAIAKGTNMPISKKHCMYICDFIKNKPIDQAIKEMQEVIAYKRVIPMRGEIPHRSALGIMSGRYPINASKQFIYLLKALKGNSIANGLNIDKTRIYFGSATWDSRPGRRGGTRFKRAFVLLKAKEFDNQKMKEKKK